MEDKVSKSTTKNGKTSRAATKTSVSKTPNKISSKANAAKKKKTLQKEQMPIDDIPEVMDSETVDAEVMNQPQSLNALVPVSDRALSKSDPVSQYMMEVRRYPLLTREQEREIAVKYVESGDPALAEILVTSNLRFVVKIAAEYSKFGARLIDLIQEGNVGLMHAVKDFDPYKNVRLITYAVWWIRGYIQEYLMRQYSMVRIGTTQNQRKLFYQLQKHREELERMGLEAGIKQLSGRLGIPENEVEMMTTRMSGKDISLDQPLGDTESATLLDMQSDGDSFTVVDEMERQESLHLLSEKIEHLRPQLSEREIVLLDERLLSDEPLTLQEVGDRYGITREAVRQMEARLIKKIKSELEDTMSHQG